MKKIKAKQYKIYLGDDAFNKFDFGGLKASTFVIVTDRNVDKILSRGMVATLRATKTPVAKIVVPADESSKTLKMAEKALGQLASRNIDKEAVIIAMGGGIVGDLAGFIASVYKRGIRYVHVPTSLLAQVDSSIGGKNGINLKEGKNLVGTSYPPVAVVTDTTQLSTLPRREIRQGMAEIIKYGVIWDKKIFNYIEKNLNKADIDFYKTLVARGVKAKVKICDKDMQDEGLRKIINYGHTVGHALEATSGHKITHGEGVALGMQTEAFISTTMGVLNKYDMQRQNELIAKLGIRPKLTMTDSQLISVMRRDKKSKNGRLYFVMPSKIGSVHRNGKKYAFEASEAVVRKSLTYLRKLLEQPK